MLYCTYVEFLKATISKCWCSMKINGLILTLLDILALAFKKFTKEATQRMIFLFLSNPII